MYLVYTLYKYVYGYQKFKGLNNKYLKLGV